MKIKCESSNPDAAFRGGKGIARRMPKAANGNTFPCGRAA